jgi:mevalonate kinase
MTAKSILRPEINLREVTMKYGHLIVFTRNDSAEIWGFRYALTLFIGTLKIMASTGAFVRVVCALKHSMSSFPCSPSMILT